MATLADLNAGAFVTDVITECVSNSTVVYQARFIRVGRLCQLRLMCSRSSACGSGGNIWQGSLGTVAINYAPTEVAAMGSSFYGALAIGISVTPDGTLTIRNCSPSSLGANLKFTVSLEWLYEGALPPT